MVLTLAACRGAEVGDNSSEEAPVTTETTKQPAAQPVPDAAKQPAAQPVPDAAEAPEAPGPEAVQG